MRAAMLFDLECPVADDGPAVGRFDVFNHPFPVRSTAPTTR
ncbi:hypothetical protein ACGFYU_01145 [Streptomyces sp. NPDC048337]